MFGLMRSCGCGSSPEAKRLRQLHYCGTCKATGRLFGQRARLTLNYDAVFLGELLLALERKTLPTSFTSRRCFSLPVVSDIPAPLVYAAAANLALAEFALADKLADGEGRHWKLARHGLANAFACARETLRRFGVPLETLFAQHQKQAQAEANPTTLAALATPTATATRLVFAQGNVTHSEVLGTLGEAFGRLIYVLDALKDRTDDLKRGAFNALTATKTALGEARRYIREQQSLVQAALAVLPLAQADQQRFSLQLNASVNHALLSTQEQRPLKPRYEPPQQKSCRCPKCTGQDICDTCACLSCDCTCNCCGDLCASLACESCGNCGCGACCCTGC
ncbi:DUF5685 family protein [Armatimonas sp.]|uniref:DUF5685 family protein n=1 Tax=Armatimonas sp. TaxID=1872638 RepID=UPI00286C4E8C|nr:DUF5685 family protein [Armatimonas sp.]